MQHPKVKKKMYKDFLLIGHMELLAKQNYMRERNGAPKWNVLMSGSPVANPKSGLDN
jgi:hypothetical protein